MKKNILHSCTVRLKKKKCVTIPACDNHAETGHRMRRRGNTLYRIISTAIIVASIVCAAVPGAHATTTTPQYGVNVAVLPFEVFSVEKEPNLGIETTDLLEKHLALNASIVCVDSRHVNTMIQSNGYTALTKDRLRQLAKLLNVNFIIIGTITKIRSEHSIDVELYTTASSGPNFKTFSEGMELESLVETIATVLDQEIMEKAGRIPVAERPMVSAARQPAPQIPTGGFDVDRELRAAFGPIKESTSKTSATAYPPTGTGETGTTSLSEETILEERDTTAPVMRQPPAESGGESAGPQELGPRREGATDEGIGDSGFFSLSKAISIKSDSMEYVNRANKGIFTGNVVARQGDVVMFANSMHVYYSAAGGLSRVDAHGNVRVVQGDRIATGSRIVFNNATQTIVATGNPRIWQGDNVVHGSKITVYLKEKRTVVESAPDSRASATVYPDSKKK